MIGRNCRIFQGPKTNRHAVRRIREKLENAEQHYEPCLNYRRDGSPFMNLLMITPLLDAQGKVRYYLGAQIDTSGLLNDFYGFEHLHQYINKPGYDVDGSDDEGPVLDDDDDHHGNSGKDELQKLSELFSHEELNVIQKHGGRLHHPDLQEAPTTATWNKKQRLVITADGDGGYDDEAAAILGSVHGGGGGGGDGSSSTPWDAEETLPGELPAKGAIGAKGLGNGSVAGSSTAADAYEHPHHPHSQHHHRIMNPGADPSFLSSAGHAASATFDAQHGGHLGGVYEHYLLVRPAPHLRILFASPSLRMPGMVQSNLMERIGGSAALRAQIEQALTQGQSVTARVKWIANPKKASASSAARSRWIHATPLLGRNGEVGVWMVVLVDGERERVGGGGRSSAGTSVRESVRGEGGSKVPSLASRRESTGYHGTDAGSMIEEGERRESTMLDGLRPPPSSKGKRVGGMVE